MQSIEYRYYHDPMVEALVDYLENSIHNLQFTPSEIRECAMLAAIHYEQRRSPQSLIIQNEHIAQQMQSKSAAPCCDVNFNIGINGAQEFDFNKGY